MMCKFQGYDGEQDKFGLYPNIVFCWSELVRYVGKRLTVWEANRHLSEKL